ncbi:MAG: cupin domain-containing protein [Candidatus Eisenbacteria bacterium]|nr:cupin domain-containing protein [Candidatus Eisenbacteria bacterium]
MARKPIRPRPDAPAPLLLLACLLLTTLHPTACEASASKEPGAILAAWTEAYQTEVPESLSLVVEFRVRPTASAAGVADAGDPMAAEGSPAAAEEGRWHLLIRPGQAPRLLEGGHAESAFIFAVSDSTLRAIDEGRMTAATAIAKATAADRPPLEFRPTAAASRVPDMRETMMEFLQRFFNPSRPERIPLGAEHARRIQGTQTIPLYFAVGMRSAWHQLEPGEQLDGRGNAFSYRQAYIVLEGEGHVRVGDAESAVRAGESYYIPPQVTHQMRNDGDRPLVLIWLAWGEGA